MPEDKYPPALILFFKHTRIGNAIRSFQFNTQQPGDQGRHIFQPDLR